MKTLGELKRELEILTSDIADLQEKKREVRQQYLVARQEASGLVPGVTRLSDRTERKVGVFQSYYSKFGTMHGDWVNVLLVNKDGNVGKRKAIFYGGWEKVA